MKDFFSKIELLGEFRCKRDLRRFRFKDKKTLSKSERHSKGATVGHHGACFNGRYHHCEFELIKDIDRKLFYFWKITYLDGVAVRVRGDHPMKTSGRGRRPARLDKKI